jgi:hypothetical protein
MYFQFGVQQQSRDRLFIIEPLDEAAVDSVTVWASTDPPALAQDVPLVSGSAEAATAYGTEFLRNNRQKIITTVTCSGVQEGVSVGDLVLVPGMSKRGLCTREAIAMEFGVMNSSYTVEVIE